MKFCSKCVLPESYPNITFDEEGVCNFCRVHSSPTYLGKDALIQRINELKDPSCAYDAILGLSGGRDSTYAAYYLVREMGLNVVAFTFDNGFMPEMTRQNIQNTVRILGLDHKVIKSQTMKADTQRVLKALAKKPSPAMAAFLCTGCTTGLTEGFNKIADELDCRLVIDGGGEPEMTFAEYLLTGDKTRRKSSLIKGFGKEILGNSSYLTPQILASFSKEFISRFTHGRSNHTSIPLFKYIVWDEDVILKTITEELSWQVPDKMSSSWRSDCQVNVVRQYLYQELLGFTKNNELLSQLIRNGYMTREEALKRLNRENQTDPEFLTEILADLGVDPQDLERGLKKTVSDM